MAKKQTKLWKSGRGKLGPLAPLLGTWYAEADSPMGAVRCTRTFAPILDGACVLLTARWEFSGKVYEEHAVYSTGDGAAIEFWSFTSDGKRSHGALADGTDVHPEAVCFEAQMPAGLARMIYWPDDDGSVRWAVESKTKKGWNRFTEHVYRRVGDP